MTGLRVRRSLRDKRKESRMSKWKKMEEEEEWGAHTCERERLHYDPHHVKRMGNFVHGLEIR